MNRDEYESEKITEFLQLVNNEDKKITSTGAKVVSVKWDLYNVKGSSADPKIPGYSSWKALLIDYGIPASSDCYVANETPSGNTHPDFSVGGHMTLRSDGSVTYGGTCYLMPECDWHNNKARDGTAFSHAETDMLELSGYMQEELEATFRLRIPSSDDFGLLYKLDGWRQRNFASEKEASDFLHQVDKGNPVEHHLFLRRLPAAGQSLRLTLLS